MQWSNLAKGVLSWKGSFW